MVASARPQPAGSRRLRVVTWNIHRGVGRDRRYDLGRIAGVLAAEEPDVIALQELDCGTARSGFHDQAGVIAERLGMASVSFCPTRAFAEGHFGLGVLARFPVRSMRQYDLSHGRREPRACLRVDLALDDEASIHVFNCHLGLATRERREQCRRMLSDAILLSEELHHPVVIMGDFNDRPVSVVHHELRRHFADAFRSVAGKPGSTFRFGPLRLRLDHIYVGGEIRVRDAWVRRTGPAAVASDHQPLVADVDVNLLRERDDAD